MTVPSSKTEQTTTVPSGYHFCDASFVDFSANQIKTEGRPNLWGSLGGKR